MILAIGGREPAAMIACVRYGEAFGFVGLYLVRPDLRGRGLGTEIWRAGHEILGDRTVGLDAVDAQVANYERDGYVAGGHTYRYRAARGSEGVRPHEGVEPVEYEDVAGLDARGVSRAARRLPPPVAGAAGGTRARPAPRRRPDRLRGAAPLPRGLEDRAPVRERRGRSGCAPRRARGRARGPYTLDVPRPNPAATELAERRGMTPVFRTSRMYRGEPPTYEPDLVFGVTTLELG